MYTSISITVEERDKAMLQLQKTERNSSPLSFCELLNNAVSLHFTTSAQTDRFFPLLVTLFVSPELKMVMTLCHVTQVFFYINNF